MNRKHGISFLIRRLGIFFFLFIGLSLGSLLPAVQTVYLGFFATIVPPTHNFLNPNIHVVISKEKRTDIKHFGTAMTLWDKRRLGPRVRHATFRNSNRADLIKYPNLRNMALISSIFLITLILATPLSWIKKAGLAVIGILLLHVVLTFFLAYAFELSLSKGNVKIDSFWHAFISLFGSENYEVIYIYTLFIWSILTGPFLWRKLVGD